MCGLAALLSRHPEAPPIDPVALDRIRDAMTARGPDSAGSWIGGGGRVGLGHRRLSILDLSPAGAQPMHDGQGLTIVFNGEIYNTPALRAELEAAGVRLRSHTDTELLLHLYRRDGIAMLERLRGMFAFALWDEARQGLLLARDPLGIKPLYLADDGRTLRVASQVKALLAGGGIDTAPDPAGQVGFLLWGHVPEPFTQVKAIRALPAGGWMWAGLDGSRREGRHFDLTALLAGAEPGQGSVREALAESVRLHLLADVPVGVFLSAGLDSTTLCALAVEAGGPVDTITLGFEEFANGPLDEVPLAETVARAYGTRQFTRRVTAADFAAARTQILADMDVPSVDGVNTWFVARAARERGLKVALSGLGGDELFGGYDTFRQVPALVKRLKLFGCAPWLGRGLRLVSAPLLSRLGPPKAAGLLEYGTRTEDAYLLRRGLFMPWELPRLMDPDMARAGWRALDLRGLLRQRLSGIASDRLRIMALEAGWYMRNQLLRDSDWAGMAHSLEIRTPLVDVGLYRACLPLLAGPQPPSKRDMAAAARPALPEAVLNRPKTGFFTPVAQWLGADGRHPLDRGLRGWARMVGGRCF